jgi:hypothetical protein
MKRYHDPDGKVELLACMLDDEGRVTAASLIHSLLIRAEKEHRCTQILLKKAESYFLQKGSRTEEEETKLREELWKDLQSWLYKDDPDEEIPEEG